ncbi:hypothetical protein VNO77_27639 [Canavalia gladiata]|uniref:Uncharacterized protein n=1 Tax=Canavalia gladiata TaxID=3824 RepID=A0AAN9KV11_CANGL
MMMKKIVRVDEGDLVMTMVESRQRKPPPLTMVEKKIMKEIQNHGDGKDAIKLIETKVANNLLIWRLEVLAVEEMSVEEKGIGPNRFKIP